MTASANCAKCGAPVEPGARYCLTCGADVSGQQGNVATAYVPRAQPAVRPTMTDAALIEALRHATLGEYEILAELGRGGMASVFLAHDLSLDRKVALKVMSPALLTGEGMVERFKREARTSAQLSHPHIIPIYAVKESENLVYFVMKFIEGRSLESIIKELGPLPIAMAQSILQQVGSALAYAHRRGVVHRDIKPGNIMIDSDGWAVVTDFGIAKVAEAKGLTMTGATVGTPSYMSPEQCAAKEITGASDQYSFGVVAWEMLAGRQPFTGDSIMAIMYQHFNEPPPPLLEARPECPVELASAVARTLEKDPAARFPDLDAAIAAIGGAPLAPDDPVRTQLMTLVATSLQSQVLKSVSTPRSPMPLSSGKTKAGKTAAVPPTTGMTLSPAQVTVAVGGAVQLTAQRRSRAGVTLPGTAITWASTNSDVATVDENGLVTAVAPGTAIITATMGTVSATGAVTVTPAQKPAGRKLVGALAAVVVLGGGAAAAYFLGPWSRGAPAGATAARDSATITSPAPTDRPAGGQPVLDTSARQPASPAAPAPTVSRPTQTPTRGAPPPTAAPDTIEPRQRQRALAVRQQAVAAGATTADLAAGDQRADLARDYAAQGRVREAVAQLTDAMALWTAAGDSARGRAARAAAAAPPPPTGAPPPVTQPVVADPRPQIEATIAAYASAIASRDIAAVKAVYPGMTRQQEQGWRSLFRDARSVQADFPVASVQASGPDAAQATVNGTLVFDVREGRQRQPVRFTALLQRRPTGWVITEIH
jgi:serine/threonine protein kinase